MLLRSLATDALAEVDDALAPELLKKGWVAAARVPAAKKGAPVAAVDDPAEAVVVVPDPEAAEAVIEANAPVKKAARKAAPKAR